MAAPATPDALSILPTEEVGENSEADSGSVAGGGAGSPPSGDLNAAGLMCPNCSGMILQPNKCALPDLPSCVRFLWSTVNLVMNHPLLCTLLSSGPIVATRWSSCRQSRGQILMALRHLTFLCCRLEPKFGLRKGRSVTPSFSESKALASRPWTTENRAFGQRTRPDLCCLGPVFQQIA